jgi:hypothetical protein
VDNQKIVQNNVFALWIHEASRNGWYYAFVMWWRNSYSDKFVKLDKTHFSIHLNELQSRLILWF